MKEVLIRDEIRMIDTYPPAEAERLPMFAENRVHQRSSGNPYPNRVVTRVNRDHKEPRPYRIITLENEYLKIELMPALGGRIWSATDKRNGYDFLYHQHVVKPALIGMLGNWISGGMEFNWPCHHRPGTFMPVNVAVEKHESGAVTVWMGDNEPLDRMKGMVGIFLAPGEARFETRVKLYNRTPERHSFLWWENAAVPVNEQYRLVFPPDVEAVQFHYRKDSTAYPLASGHYNGTDFGEETDISYHKNSRRPTSYFCGETSYDFFGGYDEGRQSGVIHAADHTVSPGKKMFTWGYGQLERNWEQALTDTDGPYAELMASSYSLNQPDFCWIQPYEMKEFTESWYPVGAIGVPLAACREAAVAKDGRKLKLQAALPLQDARIVINGQETVFSALPDSIMRFEAESMVLSFALYDGEGAELLSWRQERKKRMTFLPEFLPDNPAPEALRSAEECYLLGLHCELYRDPSADPERYYQEALKKDRGFAPALTALARIMLSRFRPDEALKLAMQAYRRLTARSFHPESGELEYLLGRIQEARNEDDEAYEWYMRSAWAADTRSRALTRAAMIEGRRARTIAYAEDSRINASEENGRTGHLRNAVWLARQAYQKDPGNETALLLLASAYGRLGDETHRERYLSRIEREDPLQLVAAALREGPTEAFYQRIGEDRCQTLLDVAADLSDMGEAALAAAILKGQPEKCAQTVYVYAHITRDTAALKEADQYDVGIAYPSRPIEYKALHRAVERNPREGRARLLLGCLQYAKKNYAEAERLWRECIRLRPEDAAPFRNLAVVCYSHAGKRDEALPLLERALKNAPDDAQLIFETAWVMARLGRPAESIAAFLREKNCRREDCVLELVKALNNSGAYEEALEVLAHTRFTPCEGGEHAVADQYIFAHFGIGAQRLREKRYPEAARAFEAAVTLPDSLGAGLWNESKKVPALYFAAQAYRDSGEEEKAQAYFEHIASMQRDYFTDMYLPELPCYQALAARALGHPGTAAHLISAHIRRTEQVRQQGSAGWFGTTPFFISYMEDPEKERACYVAWQLAMAAYAADDPDMMQEQLIPVLRLDPTRQYARLMADHLRRQQDEEY